MGECHIGQNISGMYFLMFCLLDDMDDEDTTDPFYENLENSNGKVIIFIARGVGKIHVMR